METESTRAVCATKPSPRERGRILVDAWRRSGLSQRASERHHPDQQALDEILRHVLVENALIPDEKSDDAPDVVADAPAAEAPTEASTTTSPSPAGAAAPETEKRDRKKGRGRLTLPDHLPIEDLRLDVPESERLGPDGASLPEVGAEVTWKLEYLPAWFRRLRITRPSTGPRSATSRGSSLRPWTASSRMACPPMGRWPWFRQRSALLLLHTPVR